MPPRPAPPAAFRAPHVRAPDGMRLLAILPALFAGLMAMLLVDGGSAAFNASTGLLGTLGLVAAESMWHARRWAFRAGAGLAAVYVSVVVIAGYSTDTAEETAALLFASLLLIAPALVYVARKTAALHPPASAPAVSAPRGAP